MALNMGLMGLAPAMRNVAATRTPAATRCFSTASLRTSGRMPSLQQSTSLQCKLLPKPLQRSASETRPQASIRSLLLQSRPFSSSSLFGTPSSSSPQPPNPPPSSTSTKPALSEDILTVPNMLTISRLLMTPYIGYLVATHQFPLACSLLFVASLTDLLDGWLARRTGKYTVFGSIADPAADKALVTTMVISLALSGMLPWTLATVILGRDAALVVSAFIIRYRTLEPPKTWGRYWNPKLPSATVTPTQISKYNTFLQLLLLGLLTLYPILFPGQPSPTMSFETSRKVEQESSKGPVDISDGAKSVIDKAITVLMWITGATTIWSGAGYLGGAGSGKVLAGRAQKVRERLSRSKPPV